MSENSIVLAESEHLPSQTAMREKLSLWQRLKTTWIFKRVIFENAQLAAIREAASRSTVVYVLEYDGSIDFLYLNYLSNNFGLPRAYWSNRNNTAAYATFGERAKAFFSKFKHKQSRDNYIFRCIRNGSAMLVHLEGKGNERESALRFLRECLEAESTGRLRPVSFVPVVIAWERRAEKSESGIVSELYGTPSRPSSIRRFVRSLFHIVDIFVHVGTPQLLVHPIIELNAENCSQHSPESLWQHLFDVLRKERETIVGPKFKDYRRMIDEIVADEKFVRALRETERDAAMSLKDARKYLNRITAKFSFLIVKFLCSLLIPVWHLIYDGLCVEDSDIAGIRELARRYRIVFLPSHKSHIDYLLLSYVLYHRGIVPPLIAAGENLNFFPVGRILRGGGAFFIKRSFRGERLYTLCLKSYVTKILREGYSLEFFIEGGRSRTGQILPPKFGMLRMIVEAATGETDLPVILMPCAVTYERVVEDQSYSREQSGESKEKENFKNLLKTSKLLASRYGRLYLSFGEPIHIENFVSVAPEENERLFAEGIERLGQNIALKINEATTVSSSAILASALLDFENSPVKVEDAKSLFRFWLLYLLERNAKVASVLKTVLASHRALIFESGSETRDEILDKVLTEPFEEIAKILDSNKLLKVDKAFTQIEVAESNRIRLSYYKNTMLHALMDRIFAASTLNISPDIVGWRENTKRLSEIFSSEFDTAIDIEAIAREFEEKKWIATDGERLHVTGPGDIAKLQRSIYAMAQSYIYLLEKFIRLEDNASIEEKAFVKNTLAACKNDLGKKIYKRSEILSKNAFLNALKKIESFGDASVTFSKNGQKILHKISSSRTSEELTFLRRCFEEEDLL